MVDEAQEHAGLESGSLNLVVFENEDELKQLLNRVGCKVQEDNEVIKSNGEKAICEGCQQAITIGNVGHVLPGSQHFYCDRPVCVLEYVERFGYPLSE